MVGEFSYHIFLFPFKLSCVESESERLFEIIDDKLNKDTWIRKPFQLSPSSSYNEFVYFLDFTRNALFDTPDAEGNRIIKQFQYKIENTEDFQATYSIGIQNKKEPYKLKVEKITLDIYNTNVGVLGFHLENNIEEQNEPNDILKINEFGRRIYPQFLGSDIPHTQATKGAFLPESISISTSIGHTLTDDFKKFDNLMKSGKDLLPSFIMGLFGTPFLSEDLLNIKRPKKSEIIISPVLDDRMFVMCWYKNNDLSKKLYDVVDFDINGEKVIYGYVDDDYWYKFLFVDKSEPSCGNQTLKNKLLYEHTYARWVADYSGGTPPKCQLFGVSSYSFVQLTNVNWSKTHFCSMYYRMVILTLAQRASILKFSEWVGNLSGLKERHESQVAEKAKALYKEYIKFVNKLYFRDISAQEQGKELYEHIKKVINIERDVKDLDGEIAELENYSSILVDKKNNNALTALTLIGAALFLPTFIAGYYGMNIFSSDIIEYPTTKELIGTTIGFIILSVLSVGIFLTYKIQKPLRYFFSIIILLITLLIAGSMMCYPIYKGKNSTDEIITIEKSQLDDMSHKIDSLECIINIYNFNVKKIIQNQPNNQ